MPSVLRDTGQGHTATSVLRDACGSLTPPHRGRGASAHCKHPCSQSPFPQIPTPLVGSPKFPAPSSTSSLDPSANAGKSIALSHQYTTLTQHRRPRPSRNEREYRPLLAITPSPLLSPTSSLAAVRARFRWPSEPQSRWRLETLPRQQTRSGRGGAAAAPAPAPSHGGRVASTAS